VYQFGIRIESGLKLGSPSSLEGAVYLCLTELLAWKQMSTREILVTTRFAHVDLL